MSCLIFGVSDDRGGAMGVRTSRLDSRAERPRRLASLFLPLVSICRWASHTRVGTGRLLLLFRLCEMKWTFVQILQNCSGMKVRIILVGLVGVEGVSSSSLVLTGTLQDVRKFRAATSGHLRKAGASGASDFSKAPGPRSKP